MLTLCNGRSIFLLLPLLLLPFLLLSCACCLQLGGKLNLSNNTNKKVT